jgi:hypothetical protein
VDGYPRESTSAVEDENFTEDLNAAISAENSRRSERSSNPDDDSDDSDADDDDSVDLVGGWLSDWSFFGAVPDAWGASGDPYFGPLREEETWVIAELRNVPPEIAERLLAHGTPEPYYEDGYAAANAAAPYTIIGGAVLDGEGYLYEEATQVDDEYDEDEDDEP